MVFDFLRRNRFEVISPDPEKRKRQAQVEKLFEAKESRKSQVARSKRRILPTSAERFQIGRRAGTFVRAGAVLQEDFSEEQLMMGELFGHGSKIWGTNNTPVNIYSDLNPRQRGDNGTAELFGFG